MSTRQRRTFSDTPTPLFIGFPRWLGLQSRSLRNAKALSSTCDLLIIYIHLTLLVPKVAHACTRSSICSPILVSRLIPKLGFATTALLDAGQSDFIGGIPLPYSVLTFLIRCTTISSISMTDQKSKATPSSECLVFPTLRLCIPVAAPSAEVSLAMFDTYHICTFQSTSHLIDGFPYLGLLYHTLLISAMTHRLRVDISLGRTRLESQPSEPMACNISWSLS